MGDTFVGKSIFLHIKFSAVCETSKPRGCVTDARTRGRVSCIADLLHAARTAAREESLHVSPPPRLGQAEQRIGPSVEPLDALLDHQRRVVLRGDERAKKRRPAP
jgi:hypothetical protein